MIKVEDLKRGVIVPVLRDAHLLSDAAVNLLLGTASQESHLGEYFMQIGGGPAIGIFQMEAATHDDIWGNWLKYRNGEQYYRVLNDLCGPYPHRADVMFWNLRYAALMCRVHYFRKPDPLPEADDIRGLAEYWKKHYNTEKGKGTVEEFIDNYRRLVLG